MHILASTALIACGLFSIHWGCIQCYSYWCAPPGIQGLFQSLVYSPSTLCIGLNYLQFYSISYYYKSWLTALLLLVKLSSSYLSSRRHITVETSHLNCDQAVQTTDDSGYHIKTRSKTKST